MDSLYTQVEALVREVDRRRAQAKHEHDAILSRAVIAPAQDCLAGIAITDRLSVTDQGALNAAIHNGLKTYRVHRFEVHQSCDTGVYYPVPLRTVLRHGSQRVCRIGRNNGQVVPEFVAGFNPLSTQAGAGVTA